MKKKISVLKLLFLIALSSICICGCGKDISTDVSSEKPVALVIIAGRHANAKLYTTEMIERASEYIARSVVTSQDSNGYTANAQISVIVCDGNPEQVEVELDGKDILSFTSGNYADLTNQTESLVANLTDFLLSDSLKANDPEVDLLGAIGKAQNILDTFPEAEHHILILDTGITTAGYLDMNATKILEGECSSIVDSIRDGIPHLEGTYVTFCGLGNVASPQSTITTTSGQDRLEELWTSIIEGGGGKLTEKIVYNDAENSEPMMYSESEGNYVYPNVSTVSFYNSGKDSIEPNPVGIITGDDTGDTVNICLQTSDLGGFVPNEATFLNKDKAISTLNTLSEDLSRFLSRTSGKLYVIGSVAKTAPDNSIRNDPVSA